ncbi:MAG: DUF2807 domain-containing protein [Oscillospiraceae bacterium]|nr:DUF2807 domain-containing protein [Oscillospiraceae bacterium]
MVKKIVGLILTAALLVMLGGCVVIGGGGFGARMTRGNRNVVEREFTVDAEHLPDFSTPPNVEYDEFWDSLVLVILNLDLHNAPNNRGPQLIVDEALGNRLVIRTDENLFDYLNVNVRENHVSIMGWGGRRLRSTEFTIMTGLPFTHLQIEGVWDVNYNNPGVPYAQISLRGVVNGEFDFGQLQDRMDLQMEGVGTAHLRGSAPYATIALEGVANVRGFDFAIENADVRVDGVGTVDVYATETLMAHVRGVGTVRYDGGARVTRDVDGVGRVRAR